MDEKDEKKCPICGQPTFLVYNKHPRKDGLCYMHSKMLFNKEIEQCENCGKWHNTNEPCECEKIKEKQEEANNENEEEIEQENTESELTCLLCGKPSNGYHFCLDCWKKYHDRAIDVCISFCREAKIIDEYGNRNKKTKDGHFVRSLAEREIANYLFDHRVRVVYEQSITYTNEQGEEKALHPDFYLPDYNLYIEFNGLNSNYYLEMKNYSSKIYEQLGLTVETIQADDINDLELTIARILKKYKPIN